MKTSLLMNFSVDRENTKVHVEREFAAPLAKVWAAWTKKELLDQWWAPKPWKAETKTLDFREGGYWLYAMIGPEGERQWAREDFTSITPQRGFSGKDSFCDEEGNIDYSFPFAYWNNRFMEVADGTRVTIEITFDDVTHLDKYVEMGFKEGFIAALENLDELLNH